MKRELRGIETKLHEIETKEESRRRQERKNNIIIKHAITEESRNISTQEEVKEIFESLEVEANYEETRYIGKDWKGRKMIIVKMKKFEDKLEVLRSKRKLVGQECYIENDMTKKERQIQSRLRTRAKEERNKGNTVRVGYQKIEINGRWEYCEKNEPISISKNERKMGTTGVRNIDTHTRRQTM